MSTTVTIADLDRILDDCAMDAPSFAPSTTSGSRSSNEGVDAELAALELPSATFLDSDLDAFS